MRFYEALDLEPKLVLDSDDLQRRFYQRSRQWHPDRFTLRSPAEQQKALEMTAVLNDAFRTLRDAITRAEYFLEENGSGPSKDAPPELLEEVFELNMALEELRSGDESARGQLNDARTRFIGMREQIDREIGELSARYDASKDGSVLRQIRGALDRRRYISNLVRDVDKELNVQLSN